MGSVFVSDIWDEWSEERKLKYRGVWVQRKLWDNTDLNCCGVNCENLRIILGEFEPIYLYL